MTSNPGFASVINNLLRSNKNAKLLSKAKKENEYSTTESEEPEKSKIVLVDEEGEQIENDLEPAEPKQVNSDKKKKNKTLKINRYLVDTIGRKNPDPETREQEKQLLIIATKGVVQLFNVVKEKQKNLKRKLTKVGSSDNKRTKVWTEFGNDISKFNDNKSYKNQNKEPKVSKKWKVLQDDFITGGQLKDWDKEEFSD